MGRLTFLFIVVLMLSAISLVTSRYQSRRLFIELEQQTAQARDLRAEWQRLQVESASYSRNARVDEIARKQLNMQAIAQDRTLYVHQAQIGRGQ